jgi:hypothetical protein
VDCGFEEARTSFGEQLARRAIAEPIELMFGMSIAGDHRIAPLPSSAQWSAIRLLAPRFFLAQRYCLVFYKTSR